MNDTPDIDRQIGELLRSELPVPGHAEGYRERVAALVTSEAVAPTSRRRWRPELHWPWAKQAEAEQMAMRRVAPRPARLPRLVVVSLAFILVIVAVIGSVEALQHLGRPTMVLRITDETIIDASDPAATRTTIVATSLASLDQTKAVLRNLIQAINANDTAAVGTFYATNGSLENSADQTNVQGSVRIADYWRDAHERLGLRIEPEGDPIPYDRYIAQRVRYSLPNDSRARTGIQVYQIDTNGQIAREWVAGWVSE
jgi:hypothetical protein